MEQTIVMYGHHGRNVMVIMQLIGAHRQACLCYLNCKQFNSDEREKNCEISNAVYANCVEHGIVTPIWECPKYECTEEIEIKTAVPMAELVVGEKYLDHHPDTFKGMDPMERIFAGLPEVEELTYVGVEKKEVEVRPCECCEEEVKEETEDKECEVEKAEIEFYVFTSESEDTRYDAEEDGKILFVKSDMDGQFFYKID